MTASKYKAGESYYVTLAKPEEWAETKKHILEERKKRANRNSSNATPKFSETELAELIGGDPRAFAEKLLKFEQELRADPLKAASQLVAEYGKPVSRKGVH